jgi:hypothetical protein
MPVRRRAVIREKRDRAELPEWACEGALLMQQLVETGCWAKASQWLRVYRHVGYTAMDVASFFVQYFASGQHWSLKEFGARSAPWRTELAALGHRREFPTPSSVSRLLGVVTLEDVRPVGARLLLETTEAAALLQHPAAAITDTFAEPWHIFDVDATVQAFRERALPQGPDLPAPRRRCGPDLARPGYAGRKRGELRCSRGTVQHAGTGLWVGLALSPERADGAASLPALLEGVDLACRVGGLPRERAVVRADGAGGNVPWLTACQRHGLHYLTRWGHYSLLGQADVRERLARGPWHGVDSAGAGPQREAMELGEVELSAAPQTRDAVTGERYEPVRSRMVVSRFRAETTHSVGLLMDGWLYELFANDLPVDAWPAPESVALYFGRAAEENRFAQEDRELGLDHLFSYHLPGQELACLFGLMVWNLRLTQGFAQHVPPLELPTPEPRVVVQAIVPVMDGGAVLLDPAPPEASVSEAVTSAAPSEAVAASVATVLPTEPTTTPPVESSAAPTDADGAAAGDLSDRAAVALFDELAWQPLLAHLGPTWARAPSGDSLTCPQGSTLSPCMVIPSRHRGGQPSLRLLASVTACRRCSQRSACTQSDSPQFAKSVSLLLTSDQRERLTAVLAARKRRGHGSQGALAPPSAAKPAPQHASPRHKRPLLVRPHDSNRKPGPYAPSQVRLLPSEFRRAFRQACGEVAIEVLVPPLADVRSPRHLGLALTAAERQHRRRSWHARLVDNELPPDVEVAIRVAGPPRALRALGMKPTTESSELAMSRAALANL